MTLLLIMAHLEKKLFENNNKFFTLTRLERVIEILHWGNITIEETIDLLHTGALLKGLQ